MSRRGTVSINRVYASWERYRAGKAILRKVHMEGDFKKQMELVNYRPIRHITHACEESLDNLLGFFILAAMRKHKFIPPVLNKYITGEASRKYRILSREQVMEIIEENLYRDIAIRNLYPRGIGVRTK